MHIRPFLLILPLLTFAGCNSTAPDAGAPITLAPSPRQRQKALMRQVAGAELLRPAPDVSELSSTPRVRFGPPRQGSAAANYIASLSDARPKRGLVICEPKEAKTSHLGAGLARWMSFAGAGSTAFEVVPTWGMADDFASSKSWDAVAAEQSRAVQLARGLDASHVAFGIFDGRTLRFQLLNVQKTPSVAVGSYQIAGSPEQIVAKLPALTRQLVAATGATGAQIPARVGLNPSDLSFLGTLPRSKSQLRQLPRAQLARLSQLADEPLGAVFIGRAIEAAPSVRKRATQALLRVAPQNALAAGEVAMRFYGVEKERRTQTLRALDQKFPRNLAIALGNAALRSEEEDYFAQVHYAELATRTAPHAAVAWNNLSEAIGDQADEKRQGKYWSEMSRDEQIAVLNLYPRSLAAAWMATQLDPTETSFWRQLSVASTFASNPVWARDALAEALKHDPQNTDALNWGLEIFSPKWFGDPASFATMARLAVAHAGRGEIDVFALKDGLKRTNQEALTRPLLQKLLAKEPKNVSAIIEFSYLTRMETGDSKASLPLARRAVQLEPENTQALTELADIEQHDMGQYPQSIALFRRAIKVEPRNPLHWVNMALSYAKWGKMDEARTYALRGRALGYHGPHPVWKLVGLSPDGNDAPQKHSTPRVSS